MVRPTSEILCATPEESSEMPIRLLSAYGRYKGDFFRSWIGELIDKRTGNSEETFSEFNAKKSAGKFLENG